MSRSRLQLPRTVWAFGLASLFTDLASEAVYPSLPLLLTGLGASAAIIGVIEGGAEATASLTKVWSGRVADRLQRHKALILGGYGLAHLARPLIGLATSWPVVAALRLADRFGKGLRGAPRDAVIAKVVDRKHRALAFGLHRSMDHAGALLGPAAAAALLGLGVGLDRIFLATAIPGAIALVILALGVDEPPPPLEITAEEADEAVLDADGWRLVGASSLFTLGAASDAFRILALSAAGLSAAWVSLAWAAINGLRMLLAPLGGLAADRWGRRLPIVIGWVIGAAALALFAIGWGSLPLVLGAFFVFGAVEGVVEPAQKALVGELCGRRKTGSAYGLFHGAVGLAALPASLLFGGLWSAVSPRLAFAVAAVLVTSACLALPKGKR